MKTIRLKSMKLENYKGKGTHNFSADFGKVTKISGVNRSGKSSVADGYFDCMTGRLLDGSQPDSVRPHDEQGKDMNRAPIVRELTLEVDGKTTVISKKTEQKWRKPRGASEEIFDGNKTTYAIDGFESSNQKDYQNFIESIAPADTLLMCSNAQPFLSLVRKSTAEARKLLETLAGFSVEKFISENPQYANIADIAKGHSIEDTLKKLRKDLTAQKKEMEKVRGNLEYEQTRSIGGVDLAEIELAIGGLKEQIAELDRQEEALDAAVRAYDEASQGILELKFEQGEIARKANKGIVEERKAHDTALYILKDKERKADTGLSEEREKLKYAKLKIEQAEESLRTAREQYTETSNESLDEATLVCPTCGQDFPQDRQSSIRAEFEERHKERLDRIAKYGNEANTSKKDYEALAKTCEEKIEALNKELAEVKGKIATEESELDALPTEADLSQNAEYQRITAQIAEKEAAMGNMSGGAEKRAEIKSERGRLMSEKSAYEAKILKAQADAEEKDRRIEGLEKEVRNQAQKMADVERQIDELMNFSIEKNKALAEEINPHFRHFQFQFLEFTQELTPVETLKMVCGGTPYNGGLNMSDRILCEIDLVCGLQRLRELSLPIFADNTEVINADRLNDFIKDLPQQLILLEKTEEPQLTVTILEN